MARGEHALAERDRLLGGGSGLRAPPKAAQRLRPAVEGAHPIGMVLSQESAGLLEETARHRLGLDVLALQREVGDEQREGLQARATGARDRGESRLGLAQERSPRRRSCPGAGWRDRGRRARASGSRLPGRLPRARGPAASPARLRQRFCARARKSLRARMSPEWEASAERRRLWASSRSRSICSRARSSSPRRRKASPSTPRTWCSTSGWAASALAARPAASANASCTRGLRPRASSGVAASSRSSTRKPWIARELLFRGARAIALRERDEQAGRQAGEGERRRGEGEPMPRDELARAVEPRAGERRDRKAGERAANIVGERR